MKKFVFIIIVILSTQQLFAQGKWDLPWDLKAHDNGQIHWQVGFGVPRTENDLFKKYRGEFGFNLNGAGPFITKLEYGFNRKFSISLGVNFINYKASWDREKLDATTGRNIPFQYGVRVNNFAYMGKLNYHLFVNTDWDVYVGGGAGYDVFSTTNFNNYPTDTTFNGFFKAPNATTFEAGFGARYFFLNRTAVYAEVGYGKSYAQVGVVIKIVQPKINRIF
jgi:hypothetical protein